MKFRRVVNNATNDSRIILFIPLAGKTDSLVTEDIIFSLFEVKSALNVAQ